MARKCNNETIGKSKNGRYSEEFKQQIIKCIEKGLSSSQAANELGIEPLGSGYRQLYYKLSREAKMGVTLPIMKSSGLKKGEKMTKDAGIKTEGTKLNEVKILDTPKVVKVPTTVAKKPVKINEKLQGSIEKVYTNSDNITAEYIRGSIDAYVVSLEECISYNEFMIASHKNIIKFLEDLSKKVEALEKEEV